MNYKKAIAILNLKENFTLRELKQVYRGLMRKYHPDINKSENATLKAQVINEAYTYLLKYQYAQKEFDAIAEFENEVEKLKKEMQNKYLEDIDVKEIVKEGYPWSFKHLVYKTNNYIEEFYRVGISLNENKNKYYHLDILKIVTLNKIAEAIIDFLIEYINENKIIGCYFKGSNDLVVDNKDFDRDRSIFRIYSDLKKYAIANNNEKYYNYKIQLKIKKNKVGGVF